MKVNSQDNPNTANRAKDLAKSLRPYMITLSWIVYSSIVIIHKGLDLGSIGLGLILFIAMYGIVAIQNDLSDIETDRINQRRDIPYSKGRLSEVELTRLMLAASVVMTITGLILNYQVLPWLGIYLLLGYAYSGPLNIKSRGIYAALLLGFCYGAMPWLIGASITGQLHSQSLITIALISFIFSSGIIVIKDFKDIVGDRITGKKTLLVSKGPEYTRRFYLYMTNLAYLLLAVYCQLNNNPPFAFLSASVGLISYWLLASEKILHSPRARSIRAKWARIIFFCLAIAVYATTLHMIV